MCRIFMCNKKGLKVTEEKFGALAMLNLLEKSMGGAGNGFLLVKDSKILAYAKGLDLKNESILQAINTIDFDWFLYHTRVPSRGSKTDENCHPYVNDDGSFALMMNGTVPGVGDLAKDLDITDTEMTFRIIDNGLLDVTCIRHVSPNFMGFKDGKVFACNNGYSTGLKFVEEDGAIIISSELPVAFTNKQTMKDYFWWEGEKIEKKEYVSQRNLYSGYSGYGGFFSDDDNGHWLREANGTWKWAVDKQETNEKKTEESIKEEETKEEVEEYTKERILDIIEKYKEKYAKELGIKKEEVHNVEIVDEINYILGDWFYVKNYVNFFTLDVDQSGNFVLCNSYNVPIIELSA